MSTKVKVVDVQAWSVVFSDYLIVALKTRDGIRILYDESSLDFALEHVPPVLAKGELFCKFCGIPLDPSNIGQLTVYEDGRIEAKCIACLERDIIRVIRSMNYETCVSITSERVKAK
ncbi:MAG: hypothetical protein DRJ66_01290 [Thermoprotei archaeon]|nr:MAG: hypothetical protein DRJ66_01290 [Thermoprotei archaeon]RLF19333.1 MAG: hypothetical protein DRZ82_06030 [Thermoprotei archaeon]